MPESSTSRWSSFWGRLRGTGSWSERSASWKNQPSLEKEPFLVVPLAPRPGSVHLDVTSRLLDLVNRGRDRFQFVMKAARPLPSPPASAGTASLQSRLLATLPWEKSPEHALERARKENRLVLAWILPGTGGGRPDPADQALLALVFTHPDVLKLVGNRFVPLRLSVPAGLFTCPHRKGAPDPLAPLGTDCGKTKAPALCVSSGKGKCLGTLNRMGTFDPGTVYRFLHSALAGAGLLDPGRPGKSRDLLERGELQAAERAFRKLPAPGRAYGLSRVAALRGNHDLAARKAREAALARRPGAGDALVQEGVSRMRLGDFEKAQALLVRALAAPAPPSRMEEALYFLGCLARRRKDPVKAASFWKRLVRERPKSPWALRARAMLGHPGRFVPFENLRSLPTLSPETAGKERPKGEGSLSTRALRYLLWIQERNGSWPPDTEQYRAAVTALSAHALEVWAPRLGGNLRKEAGRAVELAVSWLEDYLETQDPRRADSFGAAYILDFLLARYEAKKGKHPGKLVQKAADFLLQGQCPNGAWSYSFKFGTLWKGGFGGWPRTDKGRTHSVNTGPALLFLERARKKGFKVDPGRLAMAVKALKAMRAGPGVYTYTYPFPRNFMKPDSSIARGPVCEQALFLCGAVPKKDLETALETFMKFRAGLALPLKINAAWSNPHAFSCYFFFFAYYHAALATRELGGKKGKEILSGLRKDILRLPEPDGTWLDWHMTGKPYGTAMALTILYMARELR